MTTASREQLRAEFNRLPYPSTDCSCSLCRGEAFDAFIANRGAEETSAAWAVTPVNYMIIDEATDFYKLPSLNTPVEIDAAPLPAEIVSERDRIMAKLSEYFHKLIPDHEVEDHGDYLIWTGYTGSQTFALTPKAVYDNYTPVNKLKGYGYSDSDLARAEETAPWVYPSEKPLMVQGWFREPGPLGVDDSIVRFRRVVPSTGRMWVVDAQWGDVEADYIHPLRVVNAGMIPCRPADVPARARLKIIDRVLRVRYDVGQITSYQRDRGRAIVAARLDALRWVLTEAVPQWRGHPLSEFVLARHDFGRLGEMVATPDDHYAYQFVDLLGSLHIDTYKQRELVDLWNDRSNCDGVQFADCGHLTPDDDAVEVWRRGETIHVCASCSDRDYVYVEDTEDRRPESDVYYHGDGEYYSYPVDEDEDEGEDEDEDEDDEDDEYVQSYSANVLDSHAPDRTIVPSPFGDFLMGVELEVVPRNGASDRAKEHTHEELCADYAILKHDGSLKAGGFEIVTAPRGLKEHIERFTAWEPHDSLRAWDVGCCGLHVHISSQAFSQATLGKFIEFINSKDNVRLIRAIAGRHAETDAQAQSYCKVDGMTPGNPKKTLAGKSPERYYMVNTCNLGSPEIIRLGLTQQHRGKQINTVELRIFRASLKKERLLAQIEFAHAAVMFCRATSMRELGQPAFLAWLQKAAGMYPNLAKWFGVKANTTAIVESPPAQALAEV